MLFRGAKSNHDLSVPVSQTISASSFFSFIERLLMVYGHAQMVQESYVHCGIQN